MGITMSYYVGKIWIWESLEFKQKNVTKEFGCCVKDSQIFVQKGTINLINIQQVSWQHVRTGWQKMH